MIGRNTKPASMNRSRQNRWNAFSGVATCPVIAAFTLLLLLQASASAQVSDQVVGSNGAPTRGRIVAISKAEISIEVAGVKRSFPVNQVQRVSFAQEPAELRKARDSALRGQLEFAKSELAKIDMNAVTRPDIRQEIFYYAAYCNAKMAMAGQVDKKAAGGQLLGFIQQNPNSYHYFPAVELFGQLAESVGSFDTAATYYAKVGEAPWPEYAMRAAVLEGGALIASDKHTDALARFKKVQSMGSSLNSQQARDQVMFARVGEAVCLGHAGKQQEGLAIIEKIIKENNPREMPALFARAYNAQGVCYLKAGQEKDALLAFLHTETLFPNESGPRAEALYHLSFLWDKVKKSDRANRARSQLREQYAGTIWATKNR